MGPSFHIKICGFLCLRHHPFNLIFENQIVFTVGPSNSSASHLTLFMELHVFPLHLLMLTNLYTALKVENEREHNMVQVLQYHTYRKGLQPNGAKKFILVVEYSITKFCFRAY